VPNLADLMSSARNYPTGQTQNSTLMEERPQPEGAPGTIDPSAFGQTLASFLAQSGLAETLDVSGIAKGPTPGQFTLPWGSDILHLLSTGPKGSPVPEDLVIVPPEAYDQFGKTRSATKRQALLDSIVQGTQATGPTVLGAASV
jgi:hypothetical protein